MCMLSDIKLRKLKPKSKAYKETGGNGLFLEVRVTGKKFFRFRYRHPQTKKEQVFTIGEYPAISLQQARNNRNDAKELLANGIDPNEYKKELLAENQAKEQAKQEKQNRMTFAELFELWHKHNSLTSWSNANALDIRQRMDKHLLPYIGGVALDDIKPMEIIKVLKRIEQAGRIETTKIIRQYTSRVFRFGIGLGYCEHNPAGDLPNDIFIKKEKANFAHTTDPKTLRQILISIDGYIGDISTKKALELAPYVFLRSKELAGIQWSEIDLEAGKIEIPAERMKKKRPHIVPITSKVKSIIEYMKPLSSNSLYLFPSPRTQSKPINEQTLNPALHRLGFKGIQTLHGFRHTASTMLNEMGYMGDLIEKQLSHEDNNQIRGTYNKAQYLPQRKEMMQAWGDYLDGLKVGDNLVQFKRK